MDLVERPVGPQPLPDWVRGAHIAWPRPGWAEAPRVLIKVRGHVHGWPGQAWAKEDTSRYITRHDDGRAKVLYHSGEVSEVVAWRVFVDGEPLTYRWIIPERQPGENWHDAARREGTKSAADIHLGELRVRSFFSTTKSEGFGGDHFLLDMVDGTELVLRGPWHGGTPPGYVDVTTVDPTRHPSERAWYRGLGYFGLYLTEDLYLRILARFCAHAPIVRVNGRLEPTK